MAREFVRTKDGDLKLLKASLVCEYCGLQDATVKDRVVEIPGSGGYHFEERCWCQDCLEEHYAQQP